MVYLDQNTDTRHVDLANDVKKSITNLPKKEDNEKESSQSTTLTEYNKLLTEIQRMARSIESQ